MGLRLTNAHESAQGPVMLIPQTREEHLLFFTFRSRFSGFWSPMDSTGVPKSDFVASLLRMTGLG
jgi:hypothetical protein